MRWLIGLVALVLAGQEPAPAPPSLEEAIQAAKAAAAGRDRAKTVGLWETAWKVAEAGPREDPRRYEILKQLTGLAAADKNYEQAEAWLQLAIHARETTQPQPDAKAREDLTLLAYFCKARDDVERGMAVLQRVLSMVVREGGFEQVEVADLLSRMADFETARKEWARAEGVLRNALRIREKKLGEEHASQVLDLEKLGGVCNQQRRYAEAEAAFQKAVRLRERAMSQEIDLVNALDGLAYAQFGLSKFEDAEPNYKRIVGIWAATASPTHPMVAASLDKLVVFYRKQEKEEAARQAWKTATSIRAHNLAEAVAREAGEQVGLGHHAEAVALYRQAQALLDPADSLHAELRLAVDKQLSEVRAFLKKPAPKKKSD
jgi:tetratricopeptide (TPR) repeat protein